MSTIATTTSDAATMLRRNLLRMRRAPSTPLLVAGVPIVVLLLFVYVFGGTLGAGLGVPSGGRAAYADYVTPGIILLGVASASQGIAIAVSMDMTEGIIARFRTMAIARAAVLTGHVLNSLIQTLLGLAILVVVALLVGFRPTAGPVEWLAATGLVTAVTFGITWLSVAIGLQAKTVESASNLPMPLLLLPFLGSGFVPTESMPGWMAAFAEHQPFTPVMETLRGLLFGGPIGTSWAAALAWSAAMSVVGYLWARRAYDRTPVR